MGGSKAQTVGYRYSLGLHLALCHGPIDAIREILVDRRAAWSVTTGSGTSGGGAAVETRIGSAFWADMRDPDIEPETSSAM